MDEILTAIESLVNPILDPVISVIEDWLSDALNLPEFPEIDISVLPFDTFDAISLTMPSAPDLSALQDLPANAISHLANALPEPLSDIVNCGTDLECMAPGFGLESIEDLLDDLTNMVSSLEGIDDKMEALISSLKCNQWGVKNIPMEDMLTSLGVNAPSQDLCDIEVDICENVDLSGAADAIQDMFGILSPALTNLTSLLVGLGDSTADRRLSTVSDILDSTAEFVGPGFYKFIGIGGTLGLIGNQHRVTPRTKLDVRITGMPAKAAGEREDQPTGWHFRFEPQGALDFGIRITEEGIWKFAFEYSVGVDFKIGYSRGANALYRQAKWLAHDLGECRGRVLHVIGQNGLCWNLC